MLALRVVEFNLRVARFAHRSWYGDEWRAGTWSRGLQDDRGNIATGAERQVSAWLLRALGLSDMDWEMQEPQKRLWLLDAPSLSRLAQELALAMHREWLIRVIDAAQWRALSGQLDEKALRFVIEEVPRGAFHHRTPLVSFEANATASLGTALIETGARTLMALLQAPWRAVRGRAALYFDRSLDLGGVAPFEAAHCDQALEFIRGCLIPRRFPEWAWCF